MCDAPHRGAAVTPVIRSFVFHLCVVVCSAVVWCSATSLFVRLFVRSFVRSFVVYVCVVGVRLFVRSLFVFQCVQSLFVYTVLVAARACVLSVRVCVCVLSSMCDERPLGLAS